MIESGQIALMSTAAFVGFVHTIAGPDHYLPFVAMSRAGNWSLRKSLTFTACCGIGHVMSSVLLGFAGLLVGAAVSGLVTIEEQRGNIAGWLLLGLGIAYLFWGLHRAWLHHAHTHQQNESQELGVNGGSAVTPWLVFLIFVFGPCEPLIPLLMYPAATTGIAASLLVALVFAFATIATMLCVVALGCVAISRVSSGWLARYAHALCGAAIAACGAAVCFGM